MSGYCFKVNQDEINKLKELLDNFRDGDSLMVYSSVETGTVFALMGVREESEVLGEHDVVMVPGLDAFGVPLGNYVLGCGCVAKGRALLKPCIDHKWTEKSLSKQYVTLPPVVTVNDFETAYTFRANLCCICGAEGNHWGRAHGEETGDGLTRI